MNLFYKTAYLVPGMLHIPGLVSNSCIYDIPVPGMSLEYLTKNLTWYMPVVRAIEVYPTQIANMGFDEVLDLTADIFSFGNICVYSY